MKSEKRKSAAGKRGQNGRKKKDESLGGFIDHGSVEDEGEATYDDGFFAGAREAQEMSEDPAREKYALYKILNLEKGADSIAIVE